MATFNLKWANFNLAIRIKINNGAVYVIAMAACFAYAVLSNWVKPMAENFLAGEAAVWLISATMLKSQTDNNKLDVDAAKAGAGEKLNAIKAAAAGIAAPPCPERAEEAK